MTESGQGVVGRIDTKQYSDDQLPNNWDKLTDSEKLETLRSVDPIEENTDYNTTVTGMHEYFAQEIDPTQTIDENVTHLALGNDGSAPSSTNASLNNEIFRKSVTSHSQNGTELLTSTFIDTGEANGFTLREVGLFAGTAGSRMWNHSTIADISKDSSRTITIDVTLTFDSA